MQGKKVLFYFLHFSQLFVAQPAGMLACKNFGYAELTLHSKVKRKASFPFALLSFFCNFANEMN